MTKRRKKLTGVNKTYYNLATASSLRPYFDAFLAEPEVPLFIPASHNNIAVGTLVVKLNEGLRYLTDQDLPAFDKYRALRLAVTFRKVADGVILQLRPGFNTTVGLARTNLSAAGTTDKADWKQRVVGFLESATVRPCELHLEDVILRDIDLEWLDNFRSQIPGCGITYQGKDLYVRIK